MHFLVLSQKQLEEMFWEKHEVHYAQFNELDAYVNKRETKQSVVRIVVAEITGEARSDLKS